MFCRKRRRLEAEEKLAIPVAERDGGQIKAIWHIRVGLAHSSIPMRTLQDICRDFSVSEANQVSFGYVGPIRDAFCELVKGQSRARACSLVAAARPSGIERPEVETRPLYVRHVQDEAGMRIRSYDAAVDEDPSLARPPDGRRPARGRTSKRQNNLMSMHIEGQSSEWLTELQALLRKDAGIIATAMI